MFMSDRALYVIVFDETMGSKAAREVATAITYIYAKVISRHYRVFED